MTVCFFQRQTWLFDYGKFSDSVPEWFRQRNLLDYLTWLERLAAGSSSMAAQTGNTVISGKNSKITFFVFSCTARYLLTYRKQKKMNINGILPNLIRCGLSLKVYNISRVFPVLAAILLFAVVVATIWGHFVWARKLIDTRLNYNNTYVGCVLSY